MNRHSTIPKPGFTYCRRCAIRVDHPLVQRSTTDPTLCAWCATKTGNTQPPDEYVTRLEAMEIIGVKQAAFSRKYAPRLTPEKAKIDGGRKRTVYRRSDVERVATNN